MDKYPVAVVLADIRSAQNVGAIFRTADAAGVSHVFLSGYTPAPIDRFGRTRADIKKASLGAEEWMPWAQYDAHEACVADLRAQEFAIVAVEQTKDAVPYTDFAPKGPVALVLGNEVEGVPDVFLKVADATIVIPMSGKKESLNVSVAAGIVLFRVRDHLGSVHISKQREH